MEKRVSIFGSYKPDKDNIEYKTAYNISYLLVKKGFTIVNGGGKGIMKASSLGAKDANGKSIGVVLDGLYTNPKNYLNTEIIICNNLYDRLKELINKSIAYIIFSGGTGTLAELSLTWELMNKNFLKKTPIICYGDYWKPIIDIFKNNPFYINENTIDLVKLFNNADDIISYIIN